MEPNALHIWPRGEAMMIALPNADRTFTCTLFWPYTGPRGFDRLRTDTDIVRYFEREFGDAAKLMPTLVEDYQKNPVGSLCTVRCSPWHYGAGVVLIGDAAHAVVPFYGQGMNCAFEDCVVLDDCIERGDGDFSAILTEYTSRRKQNADAIADLAIANFIEMRDKVGSRAFRLRKRTEKLLHRWVPGMFTPLYNMVSFSTMPYADARRRDEAQRRIIRWTIGAVGLIGLAAIVLIVGLVFRLV
jgi:kynurenine 3-monooxygenase